MKFFLWPLLLLVPVYSFGVSQEDQIRASISELQQLILSDRSIAGLIDDLTPGDLESYVQNFSVVNTEEDFAKLDSINQFFFFAIKRHYDSDTLKQISMTQLVDAMIKADVYNLRVLFPADLSTAKILIQGKDATVSLGDTGRQMVFVYSQKKQSWLFNPQGEFRFFYFSIGGRNYQERKEKYEKIFQVKLSEILS